MKIRFQAEANIDPDICRAVCRREPSIEFESHVGLIPDGTPDADVLRLAAQNGRVLVSADLRTLIVHFAEFISHSQSPGVILIPSSRSLSVIEGILLVWLSWTPKQLKNHVLWLPRVGVGD